MNAFDALAPTYDRDFTASPIAAYLRDRVHARLARRFDAGAHALELGCGTGEDALWLARRGVRVTATDASAGMIALARAKTAGEPLVSAHWLDLNQLPNGNMGIFDGVFANFGVLNCVHDLPTLAGWLAERVRRGGAAAFAVMSPLCVWEIGWHALHGSFRVAGRRLRGGARFEVKGAALSVYYPSIRDVTRAFAPRFRRIHKEPLGLALPPSDVYGALERRPALLRVLLALEQRIGYIGALAAFADHYWIEFERV